MTDDCDVCDTFASLRRQFAAMAKAYEVKGEEKDDEVLRALGRACDDITAEGGLIDILDDLGHADERPEAQIEVVTHIMVMMTLALQERTMGGWQILNDPEHLRRFYRLVFDTFEAYRLTVIEAALDLSDEVVAPSGETVH